MAPNSGNVQVAAMEVFGRTSSAGIVRSRYQGRCKMHMKEPDESNCSHERNPRDKLIEAFEMWKKRESNDKDILRLDMIKKQCQEEGRRGSGVGADLAAVTRNLSRRCSGRGESVMDVQDPWAGQENTTYSFEELVNPSECKSELAKKRDQLKLETDCFENVECFLELQGLLDKRKVDDIRRCAILYKKKALWNPNQIRAERSRSTLCQAAQETVSIGPRKSPN